MSLLCGAFYAECPYYVVLYMQNVLVIMWCFICRVSVRVKQLTIGIFHVQFPSRKAKILHLYARCAVTGDDVPW